MENGILIWGLIGFTALIVMFQAVPAVIVFTSMIKGLFASSEKTTTEVM